jgi:hypothetical protein
VVVIETADLRAIQLPPAFETLADRSDNHVRNLVAAKGQVRLRLCLRCAPPRRPDCLVILRVPCVVMRLAAAARFEQVTREFRPGSQRSVSPPAYRRSKLVQLLAIHDALDAGANPHDLAFGLIFPRHRPLIGATWKGSGERRHTLRLIADARRLVDGGYLRVLQHR